MFQGNRPGKAKKIDKLEKNRWYNVKIIVEGASHKVYMDNELMWDETNDQIKKGKVAIGTWSGVVEIWQVDDFKVNGKGIPGDTPVEPSFKLATCWGYLKAR